MSFIVKYFQIDASLLAAYVIDNTNRGIRAYPDLEAVADEYAFGAGHVNPTSALDPGLVYDIDPMSYMDLLCSSESARAIKDFLG